MGRMRSVKEGPLSQMVDRTSGDWQYVTLAGHLTDEPLRAAQLDGGVRLRYVCPVAAPGCAGGLLTLAPPRAPSGGVEWSGSAAAPSLGGEVSCSCGWTGGLRAGSWVRGSGPTTSQLVNSRRRS